MRAFAFVKALLSAIKRDRLSLVAAAVGFRAVLSVFPALAAVVSLYGLLADDAAARSHADAIGAVVPADVQRLLHSELRRLAATAANTLGAGLIVGILVALWSAQQGTAALLQALNIVYQVQERRGFLRRTVLSLALTGAAVIVAVLLLAAVVLVPSLIGSLPGTRLAGVVTRVLRWPALAVLTLLALEALYHWGPSRARPRWRWVSWGSALGTMLWLLGSYGFSFYIEHFGSYDRTYGSVAAVFILLTWLYLAGYVVLLGAEVNALQKPSPAKPALPVKKVP